MQTSWLSKKHSSTAYVFQMRESTAKSIQHRQKHALMSADEQHNKQPTPCNSRRESAKEQKNRTALRKSSSAWYLREQQGEVSLADVWDQSSPRGRGDARLKWRGRTRGRNEASLPRQYAIWMFSEMRQELASGACYIGLNIGHQDFRSGRHEGVDVEEGQVLPNTSASCQQQSEHYASICLGNCLHVSKGARAYLPHI